MLPILYQDDHLVVIHKPAGLLVHRSELDRRETRFAVQLLRDQLGRRVYPAHRLDRGTSGVLVFALDKETGQALSRQFENQTVGKDYLAVVRGYPEEAGIIDHALSRQPDPMEHVHPDALLAPQPALTRYRRLATVELPVAVDTYATSRYALLHLMPETGRRHQLRRHLKHLAHPIIGDATYGKGRHNRMVAERYACPRLLLACVAMSLHHPLTGQALELVAPVDGAFADLIRRWGWADALPPSWLAPEAGPEGRKVPAP